MISSIHFPSTRLLVCAFIVFQPFLALSQSISIDENFTDWTTNELLAEDPTGDAGQSGIDLNQLWLANDDAHLFVRFNTGKVINLQQNNLLRLYIDIDNNPATGDFVNGIGADLYYDFGMRDGRFISGNQNIDIEHPDIGLHSLPTVTSNEFELAILRKFKAGNSSQEMENIVKVSLVDLSFNGDQIPDDPELFQYSMKADIPASSPEVSFSKLEPDHIRLISYNSLFDGLFDFPSGAAQERIIKALNPDIIAFQEIYNHTANEVASKIEDLLPLSAGENWHRSKISPDIICVSKYPVVFTDAIDGNGIFIMEVKDTYLVLINAHLPCCDNNEDRQQEIDFILYYLKELKDGNALFQISENSPIVIVGDMNLVGDAQQQQSLISGDIIDEQAFGADLIPDWDGGPFIDSNPALIHSPFHITWSSNSSSYPPGRLDYQIYSGSVIEAMNSFSLQTANLSLSELDMYNLESGDSETASDHLPVVVDYLIDSAVSVENFISEPANPFVIYPNPTGNNIQVQYEGKDQGNVLMELYQSNGRLIHKWEKEIKAMQTIDLYNLKNGIYRLRIIQNKQVFCFNVSIIND